jgi:hypothetical protein
MLKALFGKTNSDEVETHQIEIANAMLMSRVAQVMQNSSVRGERFSKIVPVYHY